MDSYNLSYTLDIDQQKKLSGLVRRCRDINGWGVRELLQHAASANSKAEFELKLEFLEAEIVRLETEAQVTAAKEQLRITREERAGCQKVMAAFKEFYNIDLMVLDAGEYGFVKVQDYHYPFGFDEADLYTTARNLFNALWDEWLTSRLLALSKGTPLEDLDYQDIYKSLPAETQRELTEKRNYFLACSGISL